MVEIRNREELERWLEGKSAEQSLPVANRALLRGVPALAINLNNTQLYRNWKNKFILPMIRSSLLCLAKSKSFTEWILLDKAFEAHEFAVLSHSLTPEYNELLKAFLRSFADLADSSAFNPTSRNQYVSIFYYLSSLEYSQLALEFDVLSSASLDITALERGIDLWTQPLWLDDTPEWAVRGWETLASELTKRAPYWRTLVRWYEDRLHGDDWAAAQGRPAIPELEIARASLPDSYWKKGGKAVNEAIARLEAYFWDGAEIDDPVLRGLVGATDATEYVENSEISDLLTGKGEGEVESGTTVVPPPGLPAQTHGPHFELRDGLIDFAPPEHLDPSRNNIQRLRSLVPLLREETLGAIGIFGRNKAHGRIHDTLVTYAGLLEGDVTALNYDLLAGIGVRLQSEEAAAQEAVADGLEPAFERSETAALKSVLDLHGPVILATEAGQTFVADAERWKRNPRQEKAFRQSAVKLAAAIESDAIATPLTTAFVKQAAADIGLGPQPERSAVFGVGALRNVSIALIAGAAIYVGANALNAAMTMDMTHWLYVLLLNEGIKHSDIGKGSSDLITIAINDVTRGQALKRVYRFVLAHETTIRKIAGQRREFAFLNDWMAWLKAHPPK